MEQTPSRLCHQRTWAHPMKLTADLGWARKRASLHHVGLICGIHCHKIWQRPMASMALKGIYPAWQQLLATMAKLGLHGPTQYTSGQQLPMPSLIPCGLPGSIWLYPRSGEIRTLNQVDLYSDPAGLLFPSHLIEASLFSASPPYYKSQVHSCFSVTRLEASPARPCSTVKKTDPKAWIPWCLSMPLPSAWRTRRKSSAKLERWH